MNVDRASFLALTAAIAAACTSAKPPVVPVVVDTTGPTPAVPKGEPEAPPSKAARSCAADDVGSMEACERWDLDPTCESADRLREEQCTSMGDPVKGFKPRVAEHIAECVTKRRVTQATGCRGADMHRCIRDAVDKACVEPEMTAECERIVERCTQSGRGLTFTVEQCAKIASSMGPELREWALRTMGGEHFDGTPTAEGCTLQYVTVYQPWPKNWWTGR